MSCNNESNAVVRFSDAAKPPLALGMQVPRVRLCLAGHLKTHPGGAFDTAGFPHAAVVGAFTRVYGVSSRGRVHVGVGDPG